MYGAIVLIPSVCTPLALSFTLDRGEVKRRCVLILQACRGCSFNRVNRSAQILMAFTACLSFIDYRLACASATSLATVLNAPVTALAPIFWIVLKALGAAADACAHTVEA
jgi:hypothetical protein